jgi:hypothetical protein
MESYIIIIYIIVRFTTQLSKGPGFKPNPLHFGRVYHSHVTREKTVVQFAQREGVQQERVIYHQPVQIATLSEMFFSTFLQSLKQWK